MVKKVVRSTIGCDPEFFLKCADTGKMISAIGIIPGTKEEPFLMENGAGLQIDNVALEFASPVAHSGQDLVKHIGDTFKQLRERVPANLSLAVEPSAVFEDDQLDNEEAKRFGCSPDYDAWELIRNESPSHPNPNFRSCGGHVHAGHVEGDGNNFLLEPLGKVATVRAMDTIHGIISTVMDNSPSAIERRKLYGKAGCHRPTDYGLEYRVLSNFWMKSPQLVMLIDSLTQDALRLVREAPNLEAILENPDEHLNLVNLVGSNEIVNIINNGDVEAAKSALEKHIYPVLSEDSRYYLNECLDKSHTYDFVTEWALAVNA